MTISAAVLIVSAAAVAAILTFAIARAVIDGGLIPDLPNGRSSHKAATPRAGGFAIFGGFVAAMALFIAQKMVAGAGGDDYAALLGFGLCAFAFGAADDLLTLSARTKLLLQVAIALAFAATFGAVEKIPAPFVGSIELGAAAIPMTAFWIVVFMNVYNFMDGINGIAGACALFALSALSFVAAAGESPWPAPALFLAAGLAGFLPLNLIGGRLFMGDSGSQFVGFMIAALAVLTSKAAAAPISPLFMPIVFLPFVVDVIFTLTHRFIRRRNIFQGHNEHAYQLLVRMGGSHQAVATLYLALVVISAAFAIVANERAAGAQYAAMLTLIVAFASLAAAVFLKARREGLLARHDGQPAAATKPGDGDPSLSAAAE